MTELKELNGVDDDMLAKLKEHGVDSDVSLKEKIENDGAEKLAADLGIEKETVDLWASELREEAGEGKEEQAERKEGDEPDEGYKAKRKPVLEEGTRKALLLRSEIARRRPKFLRAEYFKAQRLGMKWRKPRGKQGKMRLFAYYRPKSVSVGYGSPASVRGLHPSGFAEKLINNVAQLEGVDPKTTAVRIAHSVGTKKRQEIAAEAEKLEIRILNG